MTKYISFNKEPFSFNQFLNFPVYNGFVVGVNNVYGSVYVGTNTKYGQIGYSYVDGFYGSKGEGVLGFDGETHYVNYLVSNGKANSNSGLTYEVGVNIGYTKAKNQTDSMIKNTDSVAVGATTKVLYNNFGLIGYIPSKVVSGKTTTTTAVGSDIEGNIQYASNDYSLSSGAFESTYGVVYEAKGLSIEVSKTNNTYGIAEMDSNNVKIKGAWYF
jgi:hypothetical protein